jgi:hypothetical protein
VRFAVTFPHPGRRIEAALSHGTAELRFFFNVFIEQAPFSIGTFQLMFFEELGP